LEGVVRFEVIEVLHPDPVCVSEFWAFSNLDTPSDPYYSSLGTIILYK
jgi:hypothetical protein